MSIESVSKLVEWRNDNLMNHQLQLSQLDRKIFQALTPLIGTPLRIVGFPERTEWVGAKHPHKRHYEMRQLPIYTPSNGPREFPNNVLYKVTEPYLHIEPHPVGFEPDDYSRDRVGIMAGYVLSIDKIVSISAPDLDHEVNLIQETEE